MTKRNVSQFKKAFKGLDVSDVEVWAHLKHNSSKKEKKTYKKEVRS